MKFFETTHHNLAIQNKLLAQIVSGFLPWWWWWNLRILPILTKFHFVRMLCSVVTLNHVLATT
jgi:hypothetical protein